MEIRKYIPINFELISHPVNWVIIILMVVIFGLGVSLVFPAFVHNPDNT